MATQTLPANQITLPRPFADRFQGTELVDITSYGDTIVLRPHGDDPLEALRDRFEQLGITEADIEEAVEWARSNK